MNLVGVVSENCFQVVLEQDEECCHDLSEVLFEHEASLLNA
jgi:hypothetical protein